MSPTGRHIFYSAMILIAALAITFTLTAEQYSHPRNANDDCTTPQDYPVCARADMPEPIVITQGEIMVAVGITTVLSLLLLWLCWISSMTTNSLQSTPISQSVEKGIKKDKKEAKKKAAPEKVAPKPSKKGKAPATPEDIVPDDEVNN